MKKLPLLGIFVLLLAQHSDAGPWHKAWKFASSERGVRDIAFGLSVSGDVGSSIYCQNHFPSECVEENPLMGHHPSAGKTIAVGGAIIGGLILWDRFVSKRDKHVTWFALGPITAGETLATFDNVKVIKSLEENK